MDELLAKEKLSNAAVAAIYQLWHAGRIKSHEVLPRIVECLIRQKNNYRDELMRRMMQQPSGGYWKESELPSPIIKNKPYTFEADTPVITEAK